MFIFVFTYQPSFLSLDIILIDIVGYLSHDSNFFLQGFAAGLMLSISFLDLAHNAINSIGFLKGNLWVSTSVGGGLLYLFFTLKVIIVF